MKPNGGQGGHYTVVNPKTTYEKLREVYTEEYTQLLLEEAAARSVEEREALRRRQEELRAAGKKDV